MGKLVVTNGDEPLTATSVGSCLVITLYDRKKRIGAMAHALLSSKPPLEQTRPEEEARYVDGAMDTMLQKLEALGSRKEDIEVKLIGGANFFPLLEKEEKDIGFKNIERAKEYLRKKNMRLVAEATGGMIGRSVEFCPQSGTVIVKMKF